jgi:hypothetical protein
MFLMDLGRAITRCGRDHCNQRPDTDDIDRTREIVSEDPRLHFSGDFRKRLHQEVVAPMRTLICSERMFADFASKLAHSNKSI